MKVIWNGNVIAEIKPIPVLFGIILRPQVWPAVLKLGCFGERCSGHKGLN